MKDAVASWLSRVENRFGGNATITFLFGKCWRTIITGGTRSLSPEIRIAVSNRSRKTINRRERFQKSRLPSQLRILVERHVRRIRRERAGNSGGEILGFNQLLRRLGQTVSQRLDVEPVEPLETSGLHPKIQIESTKDMATSDRAAMTTTLKRRKRHTASRLLTAQDRVIAAVEGARPKPPGVADDQARSCSGVPLCPARKVSAPQSTHRQT